MQIITFQPYAYGEAPEPEPGPGQVRVRVEAVGVGVNLVRMLENGEVPADGPGGEVVGRVSAVGPGVSDFEVGERVGGVALAGAYAESVLAIPGLLAPVPEGVPVGDAVALVRGGLVALGALRASGSLEGKAVLVSAAASGAGHLGVQLARVLGARRVVAAVGAADKAAFCAGLGADEVVTYDQAPWGEPVDLVLDGVGGELIEKELAALAPYGTLLAYSAGGGSVAVSGLLAGHTSVRGFSMGLLSRERPELLRAYREELWRLYGTGALRPAHTALPFTEIAAAVRLVESRTNHGRVLLHT